MTTLIIAGASGTGKATLLGELERRGYTVADLEATAARLASLTIPELYLLKDFQQRGQLFAQLASGLADDVVQNPEANWAISLPTEATQPEHPALEHLRQLPGAKLVHLTASLNAIMERTHLNAQRMATVVLPRKEARALAEKVDANLNGLADITLDTSELSPAQVAEKLLGMLNG